MRILVGLDLSLASTGVAAIHPAGKVEVGRITSTPIGGTLTDRAMRLSQLVDRIIVNATDADLVVVEGPSLGQPRQAGQHDRAGLWWLVVAGLRNLDIPVVEVPPASVKRYATGKGNAAKDQVLAAVIRRYPDVDVSGNDEADALVLAAMAANHYQVSALPSVPQAHATALAKVNWPPPPERG